MKVVKAFLIAAFLSVIGAIIAKIITDDPVTETAAGAGLAGTQAIWPQFSALLSSLFAGGGILAAIGIFLIAAFGVWLVFTVIGGIFGSLFGGFDFD